LPAAHAQAQWRVRNAADLHPLLGQQAARGEQIVLQPANEGTGLQRHVESGQMGAALHGIAGSVQPLSVGGPRLPGESRQAGECLLSALGIQRVKHQSPVGVVAGTAAGGVDAAKGADDR